MCQLLVKRPASLVTFAHAVTGPACLLAARGPTWLPAVIQIEFVLAGQIDANKGLPHELGLTIGQMLIRYFRGSHEIQHIARPLFIFSGNICPGLLWPEFLV